MFTFILYIRRAKLCYKHKVTTRLAYVILSVNLSVKKRLKHVEDVPVGKTDRKEGERQPGVTCGGGGGWWHGKVVVMKTLKCKSNVTISAWALWKYIHNIASLFPTLYTSPKNNLAERFPGVLLTGSTAIYKRASPPPWDSSLIKSGTTDVLGAFWQRLLGAKHNFAERKCTHCALPESVQLGQRLWQIKFRWSKQSVKVVIRSTTARKCQSSGDHKGNHGSDRAVIVFTRGAARPWEKEEDLRISEEGSAAEDARRRCTSLPPPARSQTTTLTLDPHCCSTLTVLTDLHEITETTKRILSPLTMHNKYCPLSGPETVVGGGYKNHCVHPVRSTWRRTQATERNSGNEVGKISTARADRGSVVFGTGRRQSAHRSSRWQSSPGCGWHLQS